MVKEKSIKAALGHIKTGIMVGSHNTTVLDENGKRVNCLVMMFGCNACSWRDSPMCPHGFVGNEVHANKICSQRALYVKEIFNLAGTQTKFFQIDELTRLKLLLDKITSEISTEGDLNSNLSKQLSSLSKNIISLTDKMRKQDEGLKIQVEGNIVHEDFRKLVDMEVKRVEERNNKSRQGEFTEEVQPSG